MSSVPITPQVGDICTIWVHPVTKYFRWGSEAGEGWERASFKIVEIIDSERIRILLDGTPYAETIHAESVKGQITRSFYWPNQSGIVITRPSKRRRCSQCRRKSPQR